MKKVNRFIPLLFIAACAPINKISVTNIHDLAAFRENSFIYALPRTRIGIHVVAVSHLTVPGPYNAYAEKYLGIKGAVSLSNTQWELQEISIHSMEEPDPDQYYSLQTENSTIAVNSLMNFTKSGLIADHYQFTPYFTEKYLNSEVSEPIPYTDLSVKKNRLGSNDPKTKGSSGVPIDLPVTKTKSGVKTTEEKAEEAANFIIKIRKRRFKLLAGQYDVFPEGTALETSIGELNHLEEKYLSLFIGKVYTDTVKKVFNYIPKAGETLEREVICRFSEETGILDAISLSGKPLVMEIKSMGFTAALKEVQNPFTGPTFEDIIYYRVPEKANTRIFYGSTNLIESELEVFQYGVLVPCSIHMLKNK